jgi:hypothetical protein
LVLKALLAAGQNKQEFKVLAGEKVHYSVYEADGGGYTVYLLNTDYNIAAPVRIIHGQHMAEATIESCQIAIASINDKGIKINCRGDH